MAAIHAARPGALDATIWSGGARARRHQFVAGGDDRDAGPPADRQRAVAHGGGKGDLAHAEAAPGLEQEVALLEVEPGRADVAAAGDRLQGDDGVRRRPRCSPGSGRRRRLGHRRAGEDADGLAGADDPA